MSSDSNGGSAPDCSHKQYWEQDDRFEVRKYVSSPEGKADVQAARAFNDSNLRHNGRSV